MAEVQLATLAAEAREGIDNGTLDRAAGAVRRGLRRYPRWVEGYLLLGTILTERGYLPSARACFEAVASAMPDDPRGYEGLAAVAKQLGDLATAVAGIARAIEVGERGNGVQEELRRLQMQASVRSSDTPTTDARRAHASLLAGECDEAAVAAERCLQEEPDRLDVLLLLALARLLRGDRDEARRRAEHLLELSPDCLKALAILAVVGDHEHSARHLADLDALDPEGHTMVWLRSQLASRGGDVDSLPTSPRLISWQEDDEPLNDGVLGSERPAPARQPVAFDECRNLAAGTPAQPLSASSCRPSATEAGEGRPSPRSPGSSGRQDAGTGAPGNGGHLEAASLPGPGAEVRARPAPALLTSASAAASPENGPGAPAAPRGEADSGGEAASLPGDEERAPAVWSNQGPGETVVPSPLSIDASPNDGWGARLDDALRAQQRGEYWAAIERYGEALAALLAGQSGG